MGMLKISTQGSYGNETREFSAQQSGHAVAVEDAIQHLRESLLPWSIQKDRSLRDQGYTPDDDFAEANVRGSLGEVRPPAEEGGDDQTHD